MTDLGRRSRTLAALAMVPAGAAVFGTGLAWAGSTDPVPQTTSAPEPVLASTIDPQLADTAAKVEQAKARIAAITAELDRRTQETAAAAPTAQQSAAARSASSSSGGSGGAAASAAAPAPAPAPAPPVHTTTKAS